MMEALMKGLVYEGARSMNMRELPIPVPGEGELLIRIERVGICGSELSGYLGHNSLRKPPLVMGHEFSGSIAALGERVSGFNLGDRVAVNPLVTCGRCSYCTKEAAQLCGNRSLIGAHRPGAFAEYVLASAGNTYVLQNHVSYDVGALVEPFACAVHICRLLQLSPSDRLLIVGAGPIGLFTLLAAQVFGLKQIVIADLNQERLDIARELGGVAVAGDEQVQAATPAGGFDVAVDAVGMSVTRQQCVQSVRRGGKVSFSGLHEADSNLPINDMIRNEIRTVGAFAYAPDDFETALLWLTEGRVNNILPWIVHAPLEEGGACFEKLISGPGKVAKIILTIGQ